MKTKTSEQIKQDEAWWAEFGRRVQAGVGYPECVLHNGAYLKDGFVVYPDCEPHHYF